MAAGRRSLFILQKRRFGRRGERRMMTRMQIGHRVGHLTVVEETGERRNGYPVWRCSCDCGGEILLDSRYLQRQTVTDCGCITKTRGRQVDLTGMRFGKLTAMEPTDERGRCGGTIWKCRCDCGNDVYADITQLRQGNKKSCGCWSQPQLKAYIGKRFAHLVVIEYAGKRDGMHRWKCKCDCGNETIVDQSKLRSGWTESCGCVKAERIRAGLGCIDGTAVAAVTKTKKTLLADNTSGYAGVYRHKSGKWVAQITFKKKTYYLGCYTELQDAVKARRCGEEMHDDFLKWYYLEHLGLEQLPEDIQRVIGK